MGAGTPRKPVPGGGRPPVGDGRPRPPKEVIFPIAPLPGPKDGGRPVREPTKPPKGDKSPEIFDKLLDGIKKSGGFPSGPRGGKPFGRPAPGSDIPLGPDDRPLDPSGDPFPPKPKIIMGPDDRPVEVWPWGREDDPDYDRKKKEYFEKKMGPMPKSEPFGTGPVNPRGTGPADGGGRPPRPFEMREPDFMSGPRTMRGPRKEAVLFGGRSPSTESRRPTKEGPKRGMRKAGPVDTETKNKFEEMLAFMKRFQK